MTSAAALLVSIAALIVACDRSAWSHEIASSPEQRAGLALRAGAASVTIEWNMLQPDDARALHDAGIAVRATLSRPECLLLRLQYGLDDQVAVPCASGRAD